MMFRTFLAVNLHASADKRNAQPTSKTHSVIMRNDDWILPTASHAHCFGELNKHNPVNIPMKSHFYPNKPLLFVRYIPPNLLWSASHLEAHCQCKTFSKYYPMSRFTRWHQQSDPNSFVAWLGITHGHYCDKIGNCWVSPLFRLLVERFERGRITQPLARFSFSLGRLRNLVHVVA